MSRPTSVSGTRDERVAAVAGAQRGRISRAQLLAIGVSGTSLSRMAARGYLIRAHRGVYTVGHAAPTPLGAEAAALLACGDGAVLSYLTAARMWGILRHTSPDAPVDVTTYHRHGATLDGVRVHRSRTLTAAEVRMRDGLPITSPARTVLDLSEMLAQADLEWSLDEALQQRLVSISALRTIKSAGRHGGGRLAAALARHSDTGITRSEAEKRLRGLIRSAGLPEPRFNARLHGYLVDAYWPAHGLAVEVDSYRFHSSRPKMERDTSKGAALVAAGIQLMRFTALQLWDRPLVVTARIAQALTRSEKAGRAT